MSKMLAPLLQKFRKRPEQAQASGTTGHKDSDLIFIVGRQRSGTSVFRDLLCREGAMNCDEIFHSDLTHPLRFYRFVRDRMADNPDLVHPATHGQLFSEFLDHLREKASGRPLAIDVKYFGLDLIPGPGIAGGKPSFLFDFIARTGAHTVHIIRRNKLRILVSIKLAQQTGRWAAIRPNQMESDKPGVWVNPSDILTFIEDEVAQDKRVTKGVARIEGTERLVYEDMFRADGLFDESVLRVAGRCLGHDITDGSPGHMRMNPEPLPTLIRNFGQVRNALEGTPHAWMLHG